MFVSVWGALRALSKVVFVSVFVFSGLVLGVSSAAASDVVAEVPGKTPAIVDGEVYAMVQVGDTIVVGGNFTAARSWGSPTEQSRDGLLAFDQDTGALIDDFAPVLDGTVFALVPGPTPGSVVAAGTFKRLGGKSVGRVVGIDLDSGAKSPGFKPANVNGRVNSLAVSGNRLYVGGNFSKVGGAPHAGFASLNYATGTLDPFVNLQASQRHNDSGSGAQSAVGVTELESSPSGDRLVAIGNFKRVDGLARDQVVVVDTTGPSAVVAPTWSTSRFSPYCSTRAFDSWVRDLSVSPDGSYFVVGSSGGGHAGTLCDSIARFETHASGADIAPTWVNHTGGDTAWGVEATEDAVYAGGHMRWMNNPNGRDSSAQGAVPRAGIAALDVDSGLPLDWNPGRHPRGEAVYTFLETDQGLYFGSDTDWVGNFTYQRPRIGYFPGVGGHAVADDSRASLPADILVGSPGNSGSGLVGSSFDGTSVGTRAALSDAGITWSSTRGAFWIGGKLFYGTSDGWLYSRSYRKGAFGPAVKVDPYNDPDWVGVATGSKTTVYTGKVPSLFANFSSSSSPVTGMAYHRDRIYYTIQGSSTLYSRWFNADSGIVGAEAFTVSNGISWSDAQVAFSAGDDLYFVSRSTGALKRIALANQLPVGTATVVDTSQDWRGRAVFLAPQSINAAPQASFTSSCAELSCEFDASASSDADGSVATYSWDFGDGQSASGATATHEFAAGGGQEVTLTVTDDEGAQGSTSKTVTAVAPVASTIAFVGQGTFASGQLDASASVSVPAGVSAGDTLVLYATAANDSTVLTAPAGWTQAGSHTTTGATSAVWTATAGGDTAGTTVTMDLDIAAKVALTMVAYRNASADVAPSAIASSVDAGVTEHTAPTVSAPSGAWLLSYWSDKSSWTTEWRTPAKQTVRGAALGTGSGRATSVLVDSGSRVSSPGLAGGLVATTPRASTRAINWTLALSPRPE